MVPRISVEIMDSIQKLPTKQRAFVKLSMVEIYQEQFIDLLTLQPIVTGDHLIDDQNKI